MAHQGAMTPIDHIHAAEEFLYNARTTPNLPSPRREWRINAARAHVEIARALWEAEDRIRAEQSTQLFPDQDRLCEIQPSIGDSHDDD